MKLLLRLRIPALLAAIVLLACSYFISDLSNTAEELKRGAVFLEQRISQVALEVSPHLKGELPMGSESWNGISREFITEAENLPYSLLLYQDDSLILWSKNEAIPAQPLSSFSDSVGFLHLKNGYYFTFRNLQRLNADKSSGLLVLVPLKYEFQTSNAYLRSHFSQPFDLPSYFEVATQSKPGFIQVNGPGNVPLFYLGIDEDVRRNKPGLISPIFFITSIFLFIYFAGAVAIAAAEKSSWYRLFVWAATLAGVALLLNNQQLLPADFSNWNMFNPVLFASGGIATSLGALFMELVVTVWISLDISIHFRPHLRIKQSAVQGYIIHLAGYLAIFLLVIYTVSIFKALVLDSSIEFSFINPLEPNFYSIIGVLSASLTLLCLFLLSEKIIYLLSRFELSFWVRFLLLLICTTSAITYYFLYNIGISGVWIMLWTIVFVLLLTWFRITAIKSFAFSRFFLWLVFFAASGALLLYSYGQQKEQDTRLAYARKLITDRDAVTEFLLEELRDRIERDEFIAQYFKTPQLASRQIAERLQQLYFIEGFERYTIRFLPFDVSGMLLPGWGEEFGFVTENGIRSDKMATADSGISYLLSPAGNLTYLAQFTISDKDTLIGNLYAELKADVYKSAGVYPELLLPDEERLPSSSTNYSYAIYHNGRLLDHSGSVDYDYTLPWKLSHNAESQFFSGSPADHLVYAPLSGIAIVISREYSPVSRFLAFFSFLFTVMFALVILLLLAGTYRRWSPLFPSLEFLKEAPLRSLIHAFFLVFIISMLVAIGYVTGQYFLKQFNKLARTTVKEKLNHVTELLVPIISEVTGNASANLSLRDAVRNSIPHLAAVQDNEINIYDKSGQLLASSQPSIFEKGIISRRVNPEAYYELLSESGTEFVTEERIGELRFHSGYAVIRDKDGTPVLFVNLPYYNSRKNLNDQVGFFFVALVNILVIVIIITGFMAPLISRQITARLSLIASEMRKVNLGAANNKLDWPARDEIGSLVDEYNRMLNQLEASATSLARTQRQLAWREMARQVAHEIKNPLTPMKLSIQHLQRAVLNNDPNIQALTANATKTLIEQIDALSEFATEFSSYANMPKAQLEEVDLHEILQHATDLHGKSDNIEIRFIAHATRSNVSADKNQLLSVFNNLLLNAVQAIPAERNGIIHIVTENADGKIIVTVSDNGTGISEEQRARVFLPNFTTKTSGTGLGLAISKNIVESLGGTITFNSEKDAGTTFFITLPLAENHDAA